MHFFTALQSQQGFIKELHRETRTRNLQAITCPTLIIDSRFDGSVLLDHARYNACDTPAAELLIIDVETHVGGGGLSDTWHTALTHKSIG